MKTYRAHKDVSVLNDYLEVPGLGFLPVNAFVLHSAQPVVVDTGLGLADRDFVSDLADVIDPSDVRWIWLTHPDRDHTGGLFALLDAAPNARVVTTFVGAGIMSTERPLPMPRVYLLNPGQSLDVGDRSLTGFRPPLYDNPATVGLFDHRSGVCFSSDCFGAPMSSADLAAADNAAAAPPDELRAAQLLWASVDSPWIHGRCDDAHLPAAGYALTTSARRRSELSRWSGRTGESGSGRGETAALPTSPRTKRRGLGVAERGQVVAPAPAADLDAGVAPDLPWRFTDPARVVDRGRAP